MGRNRRANIAALRQAKIYPTQQLRQPLIMHCCSYKFEGSCRNARAAAMHEIDHFSWIAAATFKFVAAAIHELPQSTSRNPRDGSFLPRGLRQCRSRRWSATVGVEAPQFKLFYTIPFLSPWAKFVKFSNRKQTCLFVYLARKHVGKDIDFGKKILKNDPILVFYLVQTSASWGTDSRLVGFYMVEFQAESNLSQKVDNSIVNRYQCI